MVDLPEDTPLNVVDHLIGEAEEHRVEQPMACNENAPVFVKLAA